MSGISLFDKLLPMWIFLCMGLGWLLGYFVPAVPNALNVSVDQVNIPIAVLVWVMVYPMMLKVDFSTLLEVPKNPKALLLTTGINYLVQPFCMDALALLFFRVAYKNIITTAQADEVIAGAVILGAGPCTAMVFVWSSLVNGNANYTLVQVAVNDSILIAVFAPTVMLLLRSANITVPYLTVLYSVVFYVLIPFALAIATRFVLARTVGEGFIESAVLPKMRFISIVALLLTLVLIFSFQSEKIVKQPVLVMLILVPLLIQSYFIFFLAYGVAYFLKLPFDQAAPAALIATSNFFELAVAVSISSFGIDSGATLVSVVGVLEEVPVMLSLVAICNRTSYLFNKRSERSNQPTAPDVATTNETAVATE